ncbi:penicillin-binding protein 1C [Rhodobacteraceae bacterium PA1-206B]
MLAAHGRDRFDAWVEATDLPPLAPATSVEVQDRDGRLLRAYTVADGRWRLDVDPTRVDPGFVAMLLTYEDRRFRSHSGVDPRAMARAFAQAAWNGRVVSGGSTLTMQVARLLEEGTTGEVAGKLRQIRVALKLERVLTKDEILSLYLLLAPYGGNLEGVRAASLAWFGKEPARLTPAEAALLVAIPQSPESRRPDRAADRARDARDRVLARAVRFGLVEAEEAEAARSEPVPGRRLAFPAHAPHLADRARAGDPLAPLHRLTLDRGLQARLEDLAALAVLGRDQMQVAILVADHASGEILASVGSAGFRDDGRQGFVDMTVAMRSPGSTLKPLVYGLAFDQGLAHPETLVDDRPMDFGGYAPQNFDRLYRGEIRLREALQLSLNIPVVALTEAFGPARLLLAMERAGMVVRLPGERPGLAVSLGGVGVSLEGLVQLYAAIARGGVALPLTWRAEGDREAQGQRVLSAVAAWQIGDILAGLAPPPGAPANRLSYKTGTSYGHRDAWAIGYDGRHVIGVWMGRADGTPVPGAFGADTAAPVLFQAFARLKPGLDAPPPAPAATRLVSNAELPAPLRRFRPREAAFAPEGAPSVAFPPDGAEVELIAGAGLKVRVSGGKAPFTWLVDGAPVVTGARDREAVLAMAGAGFVTLSVIDAEGRSARAGLRLR